jgi:cell wall-associated NlpC family hydrolase
MFMLFFLSAALSGCATVVQAPSDGQPAAASAGADAIAGSAEASDAAIMAVSLVGTPYAPGGGSPATGFDCSGLVAYVFARAAQLRLPRNTFDLARTGAAVGPGDLRAGDLVFYNTQQRRYSHVGIYLGGSRFVHAPSSGGAVRIEHMDLRYWAQRFDGARRITF